MTTDADTAPVARTVKGFCAAYGIGRSATYEIIDALVAKQKRNEARKWPDWRTAEPNKAIEHIHER